MNIRKRTQNTLETYTIGLSPELFRKIETLRIKHNFDNREDFLNYLIGQVEE